MRAGAHGDGVVELPQRLPFASKDTKKVKAERDSLGVRGSGRPAGPITFIQHVLASHRRFTSVGGEAHAGSLTFAFLLGTIPFILFLTNLLSFVGHRKPETVFGFSISENWTEFPTFIVAVFIGYAALGVVRSLRGGVRAMFDEDATDGSPPKTVMKDIRRGGELLIILATLNVGLASWVKTMEWLGFQKLSTPLPLAVTAFVVSFTVSLWAFLTIPKVKTPTVCALLSSTVMGGAGLGIVVGSSTYVNIVGERYDSFYGRVGGLIIVLILVKLWCSFLLRTASFIATKPELEKVTFNNDTIAVIIPTLNEEKLLASCLQSFTEQTDTNFTLYIVDNGSADNTINVIETFVSDNPHVCLKLLHENERGIGCAADTGFRAAIKEEYVMLARTDADCVVREDWTSSVRETLTSGVELGYGRYHLRKDENVTLVEKLYPNAVRFLAKLGKLHPKNISPQHLQYLPLAVGGNMCTTKHLYETAGGLPRVEDSVAAEDLMFVNEARKVSCRIRENRNMVVYSSIRRLRAWGPLRLLKWRSWRSGEEKDEETYIR